MRAVTQVADSGTLYTLLRNTRPRPIAALATRNTGFTLHFKNFQPSFHNGSEFLVGAFINKRARLLQSLVFFLFQDRLEATNVKINVQLLNTVLNYWTGKGKRGAHLG